MSFISNLNFLIQLTVILIVVFSCTKINEIIFDHNPKDEQHKVTSICKKTNASHFIVKNKRVIFKKRDSKNIELNHFKSLLSDGYYFCTNQSTSPLILD